MSKTDMSARTPSRRQPAFPARHAGVRRAFSRVTALCAALLVVSAGAAPPSTGSAASSTGAFEAALKLVESGPQPAADAARLAFAAHPLAGYLDYAALRRRLASASPAGPAPTMATSTDVSRPRSAASRITGLVAPLVPELGLTDVSRWVQIE